MTNTTNRLDALQVLRALAAGFVVYAHALSTYSSKVAVVDSGQNSFGLGELGVKLFFCISGFIIFVSADSLSVGWRSVSYFLRRRLIRIAPLYWCATLIYSVKLALQGMPVTTWQIIQSLSFYPYLDSSGLMRPILGAGWTLNYEMFFYLLLGGTLFVARNLRLVFVFAFILTLTFCRIFGVLDASSDSFLLAIYLLSDTYLLFFLVGVTLGPISKSNLVSKFSISNWYIAIGFVVLILFFLILGTANGYWSGSRILAMELVACGLCVLICIKAKSGAGNGERGPRGYLIWAGDGSYSTYLTHGFVMGPIARLLAILPLAISPWLFGTAMIVICTLVGCLIFRFFESPLLRKLNSRWGQK